MAIRAKFVRANDGDALRVLGTTMSVNARAAETDGIFETVVVEAGRGGDIIPHRHPWAESYFILDGTLEVQIGRTVHAATRGDFLTIPSRALHGFRVSSATARFLHVSFGVGAIAAFSDYARAVPEAPELDDLPVLLEINARHGVELALPAMA